MSTSFRPHPEFESMLEQQRKRQQQEFQKQGQQRLQETMERQRQIWLKNRRQEEEYATWTEQQNSSVSPDEYQERKPWLILRIFGWIWTTIWRLVGLALVVGIIAVIAWFIVGIIR
jgi:hypothetical protein